MQRSGSLAFQLWRALPRRLPAGAAASPAARRALSASPLLLGRAVPLPPASALVAAARALPSSAAPRGRRGLSAAAHDDDVPSAGPDGNEFRQKHEITLHGRLQGLDTEPATSFAELEWRSDESAEPEPLPRKVVDYLQRRGYEHPSPIQAQSLPITLAGRDLIGVAQTGSGKTLGFLLPLFSKVAALRSADRNGRMGPLAVVLAPTRELAQQIEAEARPLADAFGCTTVCVFGGADKRGQERQIWKLRNRLDLVVATPGRLCDFVRDRVIPLHVARFFVLDEADRMLDMGFEPQLRELEETLTPSSDGRQ